MLAGLVADAEAARTSAPSLSLQILLELEELPGAGGGVASFLPGDLLLHDDAAAVIAGVKDRSARRKAIQMVLGARPADWIGIYTTLLQDEPDTQTMCFLYDTLREKGGADRLEQKVIKTFEDPAASPRFFAWLCREMPSRPELKVRANAGFLISLLRVLDNKAFKGLHASLRKLFDLGEAADWAAVSLDAKDAGRALEALSRDSGLEDYRKDRMRQEIFLKHPHLHENKVILTYVTNEKLEEKRAELKKLVSIDIPLNSLEIQRTREYGDLRENFEYHAARARQEMLSSRAKSLHDELNSTRAIDPKTVDTSKICIGTTFRLRHASGDDAGLVLSILGPWDSDPAKNILSYTSTAGAALLGSLPGAAVQYNEREYTVDGIEVWKK
jgi:transcription elongation GreA/GreB family factor